MNTLLHYLRFDICLCIKHDVQCPASGHSIILVEILEDQTEKYLDAPISEIVLLEEGEDFSEVLVVASQLAEDGQFDHVCIVLQFLTVVKQILVSIEYPIQPKLEEPLGILHRSMSPILLQPSCSFHPKGY